MTKIMKETMGTKANNFRRILLTGLLCLAFSGIVPVSVHADTHTGTCGASGNEDNVTWSYNTETTTLTISGTGKMADYEYFSARPWHNDIDAATVISVEGSVTNIGNLAFYQTYQSASACSVTIPDSVTEIGNKAFYCCSFTSMNINRLWCI